MLRRWWPASVVMGVAALATPREPFSVHGRIVTASVIVVVVGLALAWGRHRRAEPPPTRRVPAGRRRGYLVWTVLFGMLLVHQMSMFWAWPRDVYPTLSSLWNLVLEPYAVRAVAFAAWIGFGVFLVRRVPVGPDAAGPPCWLPNDRVTAIDVVRHRLAVGSDDDRGESWPARRGRS